MKNDCHMAVGTISVTLWIICVLLAAEVTEICYSDNACIETWRTEQNFVPTVDLNQSHFTKKYFYKALVYIAPINSKLQQFPPPGKPRAFDCASCPGRGEFERCLGGVGNLNRIYLLFWRNTPVSFFRFWQGLTDLQDRISPLLVNNSLKRVFKKFEGVIQHISLWKALKCLIEDEICLWGEVAQY